MIVATKFFGFVECAADALITFADGLPGFETHRRFICLEQPDRRPLVFLQSAQDPDLCLLALPARAIAPDYRLHTSPEERIALGCPENAEVRIGEDVACLVIISASTGGSPTANLLAPVVINHRCRLGMQVLQFDSDYSHCQEIAAASESIAC